MKHLILVLSTLILTISGLKAAPIVIDIGGKRISISPPSDLPSLASVPTNAIITVTVPGKTNYQMSFYSFVNTIGSTFSGHQGYNVFTNGFICPTGFVATATAGEALQGKLDSMIIPQSQWQADGAYWTATNFQGGECYISPGTYYKPEGFYVCNEVITASWWIHGAGANSTFIVGESNVLSNIDPFVPGPGPAWEQVDHLAICFNNDAARDIAMDMRGNQFGRFDNLYITQWSARTNGAASGGNNFINFHDNFIPSMIPIIVAGDWGNQIIENCLISGCAVGPIFPAPHCRLFNNEINGISYGSVIANNAIYTNCYSTNDTTVILNESGFQSGNNVPLKASDLAIGADVIVCAGDFIARDNKDGSSMSGYYVKGAKSAFGSVTIENNHNEEFGNKYANSNCVVVIADGNDGSNSPSLVFYDDKGNNPAGSLSLDFPMAYQYNTANYSYTTNFTTDSQGYKSYCQVLSTMFGIGSSADSSHDFGCIPKFGYWVNNVAQFTLDSGQTNSMLQSANGFMISSNGYSQNWTNGIAGQKWALSWFTNAVSGGEFPAALYISNNDRYYWIPSWTKF